MKLSVEDFSKSSTEKEDMAKVPYASVVGNLMYAMVCTRLYIGQAMGVSSQFMENPGRLHWDVMKRVFRYLKGTSQYALCYHVKLVGSQRTISIHGYVDLDWVGDIDFRRSTRR